VHARHLALKGLKENLKIGNTHPLSNLYNIQPKENQSADES